MYSCNGQWPMCQHPEPSTGFQMNRINRYFEMVVESPKKIMKQRSLWGRGSLKKNSHMWRHPEMFCHNLQFYEPVDEQRLRESSRSFNWYHGSCSLMSNLCILLTFYVFHLQSFKTAIRLACYRKIPKRFYKYYYHDFFYSSTPIVLMLMEVMVMNEYLK